MCQNHCSFCGCRRTATILTVVGVTNLLDPTPECPQKDVHHHKYYPQGLGQLFQTFEAIFGRPLRRSSGSDPSIGTLLGGWAGEGTQPAINQYCSCKYINYWRRSLSHVNSCTHGENLVAHHTHLVVGLVEASGEATGNSTATTQPTRQRL